MLQKIRTELFAIGVDAALPGSKQTLKARQAVGNDGVADRRRMSGNPSFSADSALLTRLKASTENNSIPLNLTQ